MLRSRWIFAVVSILGVACVVTVLLLAQVTLRSEASRTVLPSYEDLTGSLFGVSPRYPFGTPGVREIALPSLPDGVCIWGATGRDRDGHIWVGVSADTPGGSATLLQFDPDTGAWHDRGTVVDQLKSAGLYRQGEGQVKIHALGRDALIAGVTERNGRYEWVVMELNTRISGAFPLDTKGLRGVLLYGSVSRDRAGRAYVGGWASSGSGGTRPIMLQIDPGQ